MELTMVQSGNEFSPWPEGFATPYPAEVEDDIIPPQVAKPILKMGSSNDQSAALESFARFVNAPYVGFLKRIGLELKIVRAQCWTQPSENRRGSHCRNKFVARVQLAVSV